MRDYRALLPTASAFADAWDELARQAFVGMHQGSIYPFRFSTSVPRSPQYSNKAVYPYRVYRIKTTYLARVYDDGRRVYLYLSRLSRLYSRRTPHTSSKHSKRTPGKHKLQRPI